MAGWLWLAPFILAFAPTAVWLYQRGHAIGVQRRAHAVHAVRARVPDPRAAQARSGSRAALVAARLPVPGARASAASRSTPRSRRRCSARSRSCIALPGISLLAARHEAHARARVSARARDLHRADSHGHAHADLRRAAPDRGDRHVVAGAAVRRADRAGSAPRSPCPGLTVEVADNCSGWSSLQAAVITGLVLAHFSRSRRRRVAILASAIPLALVCNVLRVTALVLLAQRYGGDLLDTHAPPRVGRDPVRCRDRAMFAIAGAETLRPAPATGHARTPVSHRFAAPLALLCALAVVPVAMHYDRGIARRRLRERCRARSRAGERRLPLAPPLMEQQYKASQWREGMLARDRRRRPSCASRWSAATSRGCSTTAARGACGSTSRRAATRSSGWNPTTGSSRSCARSCPQIDPEQPRAVVASLLVYEGEPVEEGWRAQLRAAPRQIFSGSRPMTMFTVRADVRPDNREAAERRARAFLLDSWRTYRALCRR